MSSSARLALCVVDEAAGDPSSQSAPQPVGDGRVVPEEPVVGVPVVVAVVGGRAGVGGLVVDVVGGQAGSEPRQGAGGSVLVNVAEVEVEQSRGGGLGPAGLLGGWNIL